MTIIRLNGVDLRGQVQRAEAAAEVARLISDIEVPDDVVNTLVRDPLSATNGAVGEAITEVTDPIVVDVAELDAQVAGLAVAGTLTVGGAWTATSYAARTMVTYSNAVYVSNADTIGTDVPGASAKWVPFPAFVGYGSELGTADLNTIVNTGEYIQTNISFPSGARNYPQTALGFLSVRRAGTRVLQRWTATEGAGAGWGTQIYWRTSANSGSSWTSWSNAAVRPASADANTINLTGVYARTSTSGAANWPTSALGMLTVYANADGTAIAQEYRAHGASSQAGRLWRRDYISGAWTAWAFALPTPSLGGSADANAQTTTGLFYRDIGVGSNFPTAATGILSVFASTDGTAIVQEYRPHAESIHVGKTWRRDYISGAWTPWRLLTESTLARKRSEVAEQLVADAFRTTSWPLTLEHLDAAATTAELASGYTEYGYALVPVRWLALVPGTTTVSTVTYRTNETAGTGGRRNPYGFKVQANATTEWDMVITFHADNADQDPAIDVYLDGELYPDSLRYTGASATAKLGWKIGNLPPGAHVVEVTLKKSDVFSVAVTSGVTLTAPPASTREVWGILGNSWIEQSQVWGGAWRNAIASIIGRALGVEMYQFGRGGSGYVNAGPAWSFGADARLDAIELAYAQGMRKMIVFGAQNDKATPGDVQAAAAAMYADLATRCPDLDLIIVGPESLGSNELDYDYRTMTAGLETAAAAAPNVIGGTVISPWRNRWVTNDDNPIYISTRDTTPGIHPTPEGQRRYARLIIEEIIRLFELEELSLPAVDGRAA